MKRMKKSKELNKPKSKTPYEKRSELHENVVMQHFQGKFKDRHPINLAFNLFAKKVADIVGNAWTFILALAIVIIWFLTGRFFKYSDTWQLVINTGTTIVTFLVVFLIQNTQNRDTEILNLKLDELIVAKRGARNRVINLDKLSDSELKQLQKEYEKLCNRKTGK